MCPRKPGLSWEMTVFRIFLELRELATNEQDTAKLRELVVETNCLLNVIEIQLAKAALADLFQAQLAIVLLDNPVALAGAVFKFLAVHDLHCTTGVLDELLPLQNASRQAHARSICP